MSWEKAEKGFDAGPGSAFRMVWVWIVVLIIGAVGLSIVGNIFGWFGEAAQVVREEFGPREMLRKYEWFKDAAAQLDKLKADIGVYESRGSALVATYGPKSTEWPRDVRQELFQIGAEVSGVKASYNGLAAEYNAQMAKFNYAFANAGQLPQGALEPLPREFRTYEVQ